MQEGEFKIGAFDEAGIYPLCIDSAVTSILPISTEIYFVHLKDSRRILNLYSTNIKCKIYTPILVCDC